MCVTTENAVLSDTIVGAWDIEHPDYGYRHVMAYQNAPQNLSDTPNCMILHVPAAKELLPAFFLDTSGERDRTCLTDMKLAKLRLMYQGTRGMPQPASDGNYVHEMGIYHIAILNHPQDYLATLALIPEHKRPNIDPSFIDFYQRTFYQYPLVLCCFNNRDTAAASPIIFHYEPKHPEMFMLPVIEAHGGIPALGTPVRCERTIIVGSHRLDKARKHIIPFQHRAGAQLLPFLPNFGFVEEIQGTFPNMDILFYVDDVRSYEPMALNWHILPYHVAKLSHLGKAFMSKLTNWWDRLF